MTNDTTPPTNGETPKTPKAPPPPSMPPPPPPPSDLTPITRLNRDMRAAAGGLSPKEVRFLVDGYYLVQENRIRADAQVRAMEEADEPVTLLLWLGEQMRSLENQVKAGLDRYSLEHPVGEWARSVTGVGPVIAAGLLAHIDIKKAPTAGHIFSFAGLNPNRHWLGAKKAEEVVRAVVGMDRKGKLKPPEIQAIADKAGFNVSFIVAMLKDDAPTVTKVIKAVSKRPWNTQLKTLCWKLGESFVKVSGKDNDIYGKLYVGRKSEEWTKNLAGDFSELATRILTKKKFKASQARRFYAGEMSPSIIGAYVKAGETVPEGLKPSAVGDEIPMLPPGHIHARAKRWAVKIFLSNLHEVWFEIHYGHPAPAPYPFAHLGHTHKIDPVRP